ncbi:septum formation family protein [Mycetocola sp.]|uniref:septum formation family protein n=1 Tax=Mycetocola sp. TaxID=1871042 RepID=UPI00398A4F84
MADDTRRPDDDKNPVDPPTGEREVAGADWLISQLDAAPTGQFDTRQVPRNGADGSPDAARAGDNPVLAWWREKLVAADALVNPEPRPEHNVENAENNTGDKADTGVHHVAPVEDAAPAVDAAEPVLPQPARFAPRRTEKPAPPYEPEPAFLPEPAFAPAWTPVVPGDADGADSPFDREPTDDLEDEAETGLIPTVEPALFTPRSARESQVEEPEEPDLPAGNAHPVLPVPAFTPPAPRRDSEPEDSLEAESQADLRIDAPHDPPFETEDLDNFSWKLTANDQLDPRVHRRDAAGTVGPVPAGSGASDSHSDDADDGLPTRRPTRFDAEQETSPVEPVIIPAPDPAGPRKRMTYTSPAPGIEPAVPRVAPSPVKPARRPLRPARPAAARAPRPVVLAAIGIVALLVLGGLFFLGSQLPGQLAGPAPTAAPSPTATPTPTVPAAPVGPAAPGEQQWTALGGGECIEPYSTPWAETFTVVDCAEPHAAQMVFTGPVAEDPAAEYPGEDEILERIALWCSAPGVLDADAADEYSDLQVQGTYPVSEEQWADGQRNYYCFVDRSSGEPLSGSVAAQG